MRVFAFAACVAVASASLPNAQDNLLTEQAAVAAVREADDGSTKDLQQKEAIAVAAAAAEAIKRSVQGATPRVIEKAENKAQRTYIKLVSAGVNRRTAAEQSAEVAAAVVDAVLDEDMSMEVVQDAEAASIVAAQAISDHPASEAQALTEARNGASRVVTAESVAANAAKSAVIAAEDSAGAVSKEEPAPAPGVLSELPGAGVVSGLLSELPHPFASAEAPAKESKEVIEGVAAADAAMNAVRVGHAVPEQEAKRAEDEAASVFESLVDKQVPENIAARDAAETIVNDVDANAPTLLKQAAAAASEAAADAISSQDDETKAATEAANEAARTVFDEKVASMAAVEAVTGEEGSAAAGAGSVEDRQAAAAAEAAVSAIETAANVPAADAEKAEKDAAAAYKGAEDSGAKTAAEKAVEVALADLPSALPETGAVADAAAEAAAQAVGKNPNNEAEALEEASKVAASDVSVQNLETDPSQVSSGGHSLGSIMSFVPMLGLAYGAYVMYMKQQDQVPEPMLDGFKAMASYSEFELQKP
jgi:hypothetical protein